MSDSTVSALRGAPAAGSALALYDHPSPDFAAKLTRSIRLLRALAAQHPRLVQGSSLGVEDMVVTELIQQAGVPVSVFIFRYVILGQDLETGKAAPCPPCSTEAVKEGGRG